MVTPYQATSGAHIETRHGFEIARAAASRESIYEFPAQREVAAIKQQLCIPQMRFPSLTTERDRAETPVVDALLGTEICIDELKLIKLLFFHLIKSIFLFFFNIEFM